MELSEWQERFAAIGIQVVGVTYDGPEVLASFAAERNLDYPLLGDRDAAVVNHLGVRNEEYPVGHRAFGIPHPGILLVDPDRRVVLKRAIPGYRERPPLAEVFSAVSASLGQ